MRRIALVLLPLIAGLVACRRPENTAQKPLPVLPNTSPGVASDPTAPNWIDNPPPNSAVGTEGPNPMGDISFQRTIASANARVALARELDMQAKAVFQQLSQISHAVSEKLDSPNGQGAKEDISRLLTDTNLSGTRASHFYTDRKGMLWVLVEADPELFQSTLRTRTRRKLESLGLAQADLQEALKRMDGILDASRKAPQ